MKKLKNNLNFKICVNKSIFYSFSYTIFSEPEIKQIINKIKKEFHDSSHIVYAFRYFDKDKKEKIGIHEDAEPHGTSGKQLYNCILKYDLYNCLIIVIRYYGGINLGASLLSNTYFDCANAVTNNNIDDYTFYFKKEIIVDCIILNKVLSFMKKIGIVLKNIKENDLEYNLTILYEDNDQLKELNEYIQKLEIINSNY